MTLFKWMKDGGPESKASGLFFVEMKSLFSIVLLHFEPGSRDAYHSHAFNSVSWVLKGKLTENMLGGGINEYTPSFKPVITKQEDFHKVVSTGHTWVITFRGKWRKYWQEFIPNTNIKVIMTHGRKVTSVSR